MSELAGYLMEVRVKAGIVKMNAGGADGTKILGVDSATLNRLAEILEVSAFGDTHKRRISGIKDSSISLSGNYLPADPGQLILGPGDDCWVALFPKGSAFVGGDAGKQVQMIVGNFDESASADGKQEFSASLSGNGAPEAIAKLGA